MKERIINVVDSLGNTHQENHQCCGFSWEYPPGVSVITLLLIALFVAAWKAPKWVKEIGIGALVVGIFWTLRGLFQMLGVLEMFGEASPTIVCGGLKVTLISTIYGLIVYFVSLIIRVIQKPRI